MKDRDGQKFQRLKAIFDGDGAEIREQFIYASLLLTIFERLKTYVIDHVDGFFAAQLEIKDGIIKYTRGLEFKQLIKDHGSGESGQHNNQVFRAALHWLRSLDAIDRDELDAIERLYSLRNEIGHELLLILAEDGRQPIAIHDVVVAFSVYVKIVRWWWKEIECTTDPSISKEEYENIDWYEVETIDTIILREILNKALNDNPQWQEIRQMAEAMQERQP